MSLTIHYILPLFYLLLFYVFTIHYSLTTIHYTKVPSKKYDNESKIK
jgi:tellurite resistance protein TehA-like permease